MEVPDFLYDHDEDLEHRPMLEYVLLHRVNGHIGHFQPPLSLSFYLGSKSLVIISSQQATVFLQFGNFVAWITEMIFLSWARPSPEQQKSCINKSGTFNYDTKYKGATAKPVSCIKEDKELSKDGYLINHARVLVGSGFETYEKGKTALQNWRHFGLDWAFVDPKTPIRNGEKFCVCLKEFLPWVMMPLQVVYVKENTRAKTKKAAASFGFGSGTLHGHLLAGEERFSIELDENDQVWYEVLSFSKPAHFLSFIGYPYVQLRQKYFAHQSTNAVLKHV
ncbi:hypothetical protein V6N13_127143 [Hibiscus sabdariffa]